MTGKTQKDMSDRQAWSDADITILILQFLQVEKQK